MVGSACVAGVLFGFSTFIMPALSRVPAQEAVRAMQSINLLAERAPFGLAILAPTVASIALSVSALGAWHGAESLLIVVGTVLYVGVGIGVSVAVNIPLNRRLARVNPGPDTAEHTWRAFVRPWARANHVRTVAGLLAATAFALAAFGVA
jgi:uncharacterized membrane protein